MGIKIQGLIVVHTKEDIARRIVAVIKLLENELTYTLQLRNLQAFKSNLQRNFEYLHNRLGIPKLKRR